MDNVLAKDIIIAAVIVLLFIIMLWYYKNAKRRISKFLFGVISGVVMLYPAGFIVSAMGGVLNVNLFSVAVSSVLGIPGVAVLLISSIL